MEESSTFQFIGSLLFAILSLLEKVESPHDTILVMIDKSSSRSCQRISPEKHRVLKMNEKLRCCITSTNLYIKGFIILGRV